MSPQTVLKIGAALIAAFFAVEAVRIRVATPAVQGPTLAQQVQSQSPQQTPTTEAAFGFKGFTLRPLARLDLQARVLRREDYHLGKEADLSPFDLALGWQRMREDGVLSQLQISQSSRWYSYRWQDQPPLPPAEIARSSANMHMIPATDDVAAALSGVRKGDRVRIDGWLVEANAADGWRWRSSTTRDDTGGGACEVVYVCAISQL